MKVSSSLSLKATNTRTYYLNAFWNFWKNNLQASMLKFMVVTKEIKVATPSMQVKCAITQISMQVILLYHAKKRDFRTKKMRKSEID